MTFLTYDAGNMFRPKVGRNGAEKNELKKYRPALKRAKDKIIAEWRNDVQGWLGCPDDTAALAEIAKILNTKQRFTECLVLGIGGSDLGARAAYQVLARENTGMRLHFAGANTDPDELEDVLRKLNWKKTLINVVSKSGQTVETMSAFLVARERLIKAVGKNYAAHVVATTDPVLGSLKSLSDKEGFGTLSLPQNIGGRFSVLCVAGLLPLACAGIDVTRLLKGARQVRDAWLKNNVTRDPIAAYALLHYLGNRKRGQNIHVLMPYAARLTEFGRWYRQLWAESLGKDNAGPTPIAALGATDQHSQAQLYMQGPADKIVTFIAVEKFNNAMSVPAAARVVTGLEKLAGKKFQDLIHSEQRATAEALRVAGKPNGTLKLKDLTPESLGGLFMFFELAVAMAGKLYGINAYDQPGVEAGKKLFWKFLDAKSTTGASSIFKL
ncbi:MAG: glucose-6-phosphate isomerase [Patescibacteria group bacterium]